VDLPEEEDESFCIENEKLYSISRAPPKWFQCTVHSGPATVAPDSATSIFVATADLMITLTMSRL
jgi:hypothetical protein